jgi:hypothetical protein
MTFAAPFDTPGIDSSYSGCWISFFLSGAFSSVDTIGILTVIRLNTMISTTPGGRKKYEFAVKKITIHGSALPESHAL